MTERYYLAIDGGGSKTEGLLADEQGKILRSSRVGPTNHNTVGEPQALLQLEGLIDNLCLELQQPPQIHAVCLGLAGLYRPTDFPSLRPWLEKTLPGAELKLLSDAHLVIPAGTPDNWGIGVIAGTGSIIVGQSQDGKFERAGGWGFLVGDEGSAYQSGLAALRAVSQSADGILPETVLTSMVLDYLKIDRLEQFVPAIYHPMITRQSVTGMAKLVDEAASQGDTVALTIIARAAEDLVNAYAACAKKLNFARQIPTALAGGNIIYSKPLQQAFLEKLESAGFIPTPLTFVEHPVQGALRLALAM
ncbi:MAG TPA: BadF/BadG/BcrA/BcrD ATPase family protein [Bellilinea sp.]|nr:BadF/BadG/BcrA/BcrD ATPase family protein [Bellilinea sp.]